MGPFGGADALGFEVGGATFLGAGEGAGVVFFTGVWGKAWATTGGSGLGVG